MPRKARDSPPDTPAAPAGGHAAAQGPWRRVRPASRRVVTHRFRAGPVRPRAAVYRHELGCGRGVPACRRRPRRPSPARHRMSREPGRIGRTREREPAKRRGPGIRHPGPASRVLPWLPASPPVASGHCPGRVARDTCDVTSPPRAATCAHLCIEVCISDGSALRAPVFPGAAGRPRTRPWCAPRQPLGIGLGFARDGARPRLHMRLHIPGDVRGAGGLVASARKATSKRQSRV